MPELDEWESFYLIVGGAAGALIGLQFVVMTLIAERPPARAAETNAAFSTPTIVHFSSALLLSAVLRAPWHSISSVAIVLGLFGLGGLTYGAIVAPSHLREALFGVGGAVLLLLFIGIHNAWDSVAYLVSRRNSQAEQR